MPSERCVSAMTDRSSHKDASYNQIGMIQVYGEVVCLDKGLIQGSGTWDFATDILVCSGCVESISFQ